MDAETLTLNFFQLRHYAPALARLYFDTIGIDILQWRHEVQMLARNIFSAFRYLLNNVNWLDAEDKEKIQEKIDHIIFYPGVPKWIKNEARIMRGLSLYDTSSDPFENEFSTGQQQFDNTAYSIMSRTKHQRPEEPEPNFSINAEYLPSANSITMFLGNGCLGCMSTWGYAMYCTVPCRIDAATTLQSFVSAASQVWRLR